MVHARRDRSRWGLSWVAALPILAVFAGLVVAEIAVYAFIRHRGVSVTGDEPHYLITAKALTQLSLHQHHAYMADLSSHRFYNWPAGTKPSNLEFQLFAGPHGAVTTHPLGLSGLVAPFVLIGGARAARVGLFAIEAAGFLYFFVRASGLVGLGGRARVALFLVVASPAIWLAASQIYPDLLTGIVIACLLVDVVRLELRHDLDAGGTAVSALCMALLPWLHQQNLVAAVVILVAWAAVSRQARNWRSFLVVACVGIVGWLLLFAYNIYAYGHWLGLPQPFPSLNRAGITDILGLLFDRHQGLFVQVPLAAVGLFGLWLGRRRAPFAVVATLLSAASLIYLNGTFIHAPYGGQSFAGRFEWASLPPLLLWCPFVLAKLERSRARLELLGLGAAVLWLLEAVPILEADHSYYNQLAVKPPWDPSTYPGWWGPFDRLLGEFIPGSRLLGWPWYGLPIALASVALVIIGIRTLAAPDGAWALKLGTSGLVVGVLTVVLIAVSSYPLPRRPLTYSEQDVGGPLLATTSAQSGPSVPLQKIGGGTFRLAVDYTLEGAPGSATFQSYCSRGSASTPAPSQGSAANASGTPGTHVQDLVLRCQSGTIWFQMAAEPGTSLEVSALRLSKTSSV